MAFNFNVDALIEKLEPAVAKIAEGLGTTGENLWTIGRAGMFAEGVADLVIAGFFLAVLVVYLLFAKRALAGRPDEDTVIGVTVLGILVVFFSTVIGLTHLYDGLLHVLAPDYMLLKEIMRTIQGM